MALSLKDLETVSKILDDDFDVSLETARQSILDQSIFDVIHNETLIKSDFIIRKWEDYRLVEFESRQRITV